MSVLEHAMKIENYNQNETKFFNDIYNYFKNCMRCHNSGHILAFDVNEFLHCSSQLPKETIEQISSLTGGTNQGWYRKDQLFFALKLIAAAQSGIVISSQTLLYDIDLPLPNLLTDNICDVNHITKVNDSNETSSPDLIQLSDSDCPVLKREEGYEMMVSEDVDDDLLNTPRNNTLPSSGFYQSAPSPTVSSPASDSPTPTNSVHERNWNPGNSTQWHTLVNEEHRQLLGTEEDSSERHTSECDDDDDSHVENLEKDEEESDDVWVITEEQQQYYTQQFLTMQPTLYGLLPGNIAKDFFEKSKLPVDELRRIWQLSDVTQDGALSLEEFFAAMHLVVLRRNNISLPELLPSSLMPTILKQSKVEKNSANGGSSVSPDSECSIPQPRKPSLQSKDVSLEKDVSDPLSPSRSKEWTKFVESPTSSLSSPAGPRPVNFDFHKSAVEQDPKILHPKALRVTPECKRLDEEEGVLSSSGHDRGADSHRGSNNLKPPGHISPPNLLDNPENLIQCHTSNISKPKVQSVRSISPSIEHPIPVQRIPEEGSDEEGGPNSLPLLSQTWGVGEVHKPQQPPKKELPPPPPPPRPRTHVRSSSLDLNKFTRTNYLSTGHPPIVPPRASPIISSPKRLLNPPVEISEESESVSLSKSNPLRGNDQAHASAFEIYKKPRGEEGTGDTSRISSGDEDERHQISGGARQRDKRDVLSILHTIREKSSVLSRVNSELNQELAEVLEERTSLEFQLEQMKTFST